jgi:predicted anti-sigma-YlaC factor YlaD
VNNCKDYKKMMHLALDGTADEREMKRLKDHMTLCKDCAREFRILQLSLDLLASMPVKEPAAEFTSNTVKKAFAAKKKLLRQQKIASWALSGLTVVISVLILAGWNVAIRPAIRVVFLNILGIILEWRILLKTFSKVLTALGKYLITSGSDAASTIWEGCVPLFSGYLMALIIMAFIILITGVKSSAFSFKRR